MRTPITVQVEIFNVHTLQSDIAQIRADFIRYLSEVPRKSMESKHGLMGPIGKFIGKLKSGGKNADQLKGFILNVDRAVRSSFRTRKRLSSEGMEALERGINKTCELLGTIPLTAHDNLIDQIDYGLYFDLRKRDTLQKEARRQEWIKFVRGKYETDSKVAEAWDESLTVIDDLYLPRKAEGARSKKATAKQQDVAAFWESQGATIDLDEDEEDE